jgi:aminodeoxyfutalosine deaminase
MNESAAWRKIELHVHLEGTIDAGMLLRLARRNGVALPSQSEPELRGWMGFRDLEHLVDVWQLVTSALRRADDFRETLVTYAETAARLGAVYVEAIVSPVELAQSGVSWDEIFSGCCDGIIEARERHAIEVRLTPDITRGVPADDAVVAARYAARYRERGVVGLGLGGVEEERFGPERYRAAFALARDQGLGLVPHVGDFAGPPAIRRVIDVMAPERIRHGIRAVDDPALLAQLAGRGTVLDVCLTSNVRLGTARSLAAHPLRALLAAGVRCTVSTDDPALFETDLEREHRAAVQLGVAPEALFAAGVDGALCDEATRLRLQEVADSFDWSAVSNA